MTLIKKAHHNAVQAKRSAPPRAADYAKTFLKDWEQLTRSGRCDMRRLKEVMLLLIANHAPLPAQWQDHALKGDWQGHRECHLGGDFLLAYKVDDSGKKRAGDFCACRHALAVVWLSFLQA